MVTANTMPCQARARPRCLGSFCYLIRESDVASGIGNASRKKKGGLGLGCFVFLLGGNFMCAVLLFFSYCFHFISLFYLFQEATSVLSHVTHNDKKRNPILFFHSNV